MAADSTSNQPVQPENEIDLIEVVKKLWAKRKFILKVTVICACLGVLVALFSAKVFTASCTIVPQTGEKNTGGSLSGLAAMAGINIGSLGTGDVLSPKIYPKILASIPFQKEIMQTAIKFEEYDQPVKLLDYYTADEYARFSLGGAILKYTVGLPGVIIGAIRGEEPEPQYGEGAAALESLSKDEAECIKILKDKINMNLNEKDGYITLSVDMPEPLAAAQLAAKVQEMLQRYVTDFKIQKVKANLDFVEGRYEEAKKEYEKKQEELAIFNDANRNLVSNVAKTTQERLNNEYTLLFGVYSELAKQREQANIQVKETTPVFTVVEPVTIPTERSKPKRGLICVAFTFLGGFIGIGLVLTLPFLAQVSGCKRLKGWLPEEKE
ncbi:MAG: Wzz/FepE/Etk N-terminal domain-containing protein [Odoribacter splanchnicus]